MNKKTKDGFNTANFKMWAKDQIEPNKDNSIHSVMWKSYVHSI